MPFVFDQASHSIAPKAVEAKADSGRISAESRQAKPTRVFGHFAIQTDHTMGDNGTNHLGKDTLSHLNKKTGSCVLKRFCIDFVTHVSTTFSTPQPQPLVVAEHFLSGPHQRFWRSVTQNGYENNGCDV